MQKDKAGEKGMEMDEEKKKIQGQSYGERQPFGFFFFLVDFQKLKKKKRIYP